MPNGEIKEFHIAPMLDVSTVEFRYFMRLLTKRAFIWTEMVVAETLWHQSNQTGVLSSGDDLELEPDLKRHCGWYEDQYLNPHPVVCQIGTNDPKQAEFATRVVHKLGYDRIDLNAECPSDRVAGREFGAALMRDHDTAIEVVRAMVDTAQSTKSDNPFPVSVKTRIGVDEFDTFEHLEGWVQRLVDAGCTWFIIHARKVYTQGLSPAQNRTVPPLNYPRVYRLLQRFPSCDFWFHGGIMSLEHAKQVAFGYTGVGDSDLIRETSSEETDCIDDDHTVPCQRCGVPHGSCIAPPRMSLPNLKGVMVGRLARDHPSELATIDSQFYGEASDPCKNRRELMEKYASFLDRVYPRRCCDNEETVTTRMIHDLPFEIIHSKQYCNVCREFRAQSTIADVTSQDDLTESTSWATDQKTTQQPTQSQFGKRKKRQLRMNKGAKIIAGIIDSAIQPILGILYGERGNAKFRRELHQLSRDVTIRNCGPSCILRKAMLCVPKEVWELPFSSKQSAIAFTPTK